MSFKIIIITTENFVRNVKKLAKKYTSLKNDLKELQNELHADPKTGLHLGNDTYKIRMAIRSKGKGKRGGARVITFVKEKIENFFKVYLLAIYDKSDTENIDVDVVNDLIEQAKNQDDGEE